MLSELCGVICAAVAGSNVDGPAGLSLEIDSRVCCSCPLQALHSCRALSSCGGKQIVQDYSVLLVKLWW
jgi:hypothetical protein